MLDHLRGDHHIEAAGWNRICSVQIQPVPRDRAGQIRRTWQNIRTINLLEPPRRQQPAREIGNSCAIVERAPAQIVVSDNLQDAVVDDFGTDPAAGFSGLQALLFQCQQGRS